MSSLIACKVNTNMCLVSLSLYCRDYIMCHCFPLILLYTSVLLRTTNCLIHLYNGYLHNCFVHTELYTKTTEFLLTGCLLCLVLLQSNNVRGLAFSRTLSRSHCCMCIRLLVYPIFLYTYGCWFAWNVCDVFVSVYCVHIASCCVRFCCVFFIYLFHTHGLCFST